MELTFIFLSGDDGVATKARAARAWRMAVSAMI